MNIPKQIVKALSTFFYLGYLPLAPGTFASMLAVILFYPLKFNLYAYALITCLVIFIGFLICGSAEKIFQKKDAPCIVIDEVAGMLLCLVFVRFDFKIALMAVIIFRILDILKPYPAGRLEQARGSLGVMADDLVAGLYTNVILQVVLRFISFSGL